MESIEKLRELVCDINCNEIDAHLYNGPAGQFISEGFVDSWRAAAEKAIAAIEAEVAERYMLLPVDADAIPVRLGEELVSLDTGERGIVTGLTDNSVQCDATALWELACHYRHVKPRTVEDVLREFAEGIKGQNKDFGELLINTYADELRGMMT